VATIILVERFRASHALTLESGPEPVHAHAWKLRAEFRDATGEAARRAVAAALEPLEGRFLNDLPQFAGTATSAEAVARHLHEALARSLPAAGARLLRVAVEEEPGCWASYSEETVVGSRGPER